MLNLMIDNGILAENETMVNLQGEPSARVPNPLTT
jgi:hypothetical protein